MGVVPCFSLLKLMLMMIIVLLLLQMIVVVIGGGVHGSDHLLDPSKVEMFVDELPTMPKIKGFAVVDGVAVAANLTVGMFDTTWKFHRDLPPTRVFAYGTCKEAVTVPGPTIEAIQGVPTYVTWTNHLPSRHFLPWDPTIPTAAAAAAGIPTVVHLHGGVQAPASDGNSLAWFTASFASFASVGPHFSSPLYSYPNFQPPGNLWYHDHALGLTRINLLAGLIGTYRVTSPVESSLGLPSGDEYDRNIVLFDREFRVDGSIYMNGTGDNPSIHPQWQPEYFGPAIIVNGKAWPYLTVHRRRYRFRILNASNARFFRLSLSNGLRFVHVGSDNSYLSAPAPSRKFLLAPSEIADVIVDFSLSPTDTAELLNDSPFPYPGGDPTDDINGKVMKFVIRPKTENDTSRIPKTLLRYPRADADRAVKTRYITLYEYESATGDPTHLYLNARSFSDPVTETPKKGTDEIWHVINLTEDNHPIHIHLGAFRVLEQRELVNKEGFKECMIKINNATQCGVAKHLAGKRFATPRHERGWKNVFKMRPGVVTTILVRFRPLGPEKEFPFDVTAEPGYVYHCHILDHEDNEMMRPMKLVN